MNYQLMFQTIAVICGLATLPMFIATMAALDLSNSREVHRNTIVATVALFVITVVSGALAAGLS